LLAAILSRNKLKIVWDNGPNASYDSVAFRQQMEWTAANPGKVAATMATPKQR